MSRILVIDDMKETAELFGMLLESHGHEVFMAFDGNQGIETARIQKPDLVITDLFMAPKPGIDTIIQLKREFPMLKIIAVSASVGSMNFLKLAKGMGADRVFEKPVDPEVLLRGVQDVLDSIGLAKSSV